MKKHIKTLLLDKLSNEIKLSQLAGSLHKHTLNSFNSFRKKGLQIKTIIIGKEKKYATIKKMKCGRNAKFYDIKVNGATRKVRKGKMGAKSRRVVRGGMY